MKPIVLPPRADDTFTVNAASSIEFFGNQLPGEFRLEANYPNPFNPATIISFNIPTHEFVTLEVFDALGQKVKTLVSTNLAAGNYQVEFDGSRLTSGTYFYRLTAGDFNQVKKMVLAK